PDVSVAAGAVLLSSADFKWWFYKNKIPLKLVVSFYRTRSNCPISAIVFRTAAGREFCLDPDSTLQYKYCFFLSSKWGKSS
uniref:Chemokine interleukin-8-like domain-containing protein n=1 Tax=Cyprinus carpio TaxID=7962 RepID=A0A8C2Q2P6_CYPCA